MSFPRSQNSVLVRKNPNVQGLALSGPRFESPNDLCTLGDLRRGRFLKKEWWKKG